MERKTPLYFSFNFLVYGINCLFITFMPLYLGGMFSTDLVGIIMAGTAVASFLAPFIWGWVFDSVKSRNNAFMLIMVISAAIYSLIGVSDSFVYLLLSCFAFMFFACSFSPVVDAVTIEFCDRTGHKYGPPRIAGTVGFAVLSLGISYLIESVSLFMIFIVMSVLIIFNLRLLPQSGSEGVRGRREKRPSRVGHFLRNKKAVTMLFTCFAANLTHSFFMYFFPIYLTSSEGGLGASDSVWGWVTFFFVLSEIPFFLFFDKLLKRFPLRNISFVVVLLALIRSVTIGTVVNMPVLLAVTCVTGGVSTAAWYCAAYYLAYISTPDSRATAQTLTQTLGIQLPRVVAALTGALVISKISFTSTMLYIGGGLNLLCCLSFLVLPVPKEKIK